MAEISQVAATACERDAGPAFSFVTVTSITPLFDVTFQRVRQVRPVHWAGFHLGISDDPSLPRKELRRKNLPTRRYSFKNVYMRNILWRSGHSKRAIFCSKLLNDVAVAWWRHYAVSLNFLHVKGPTQKGQFLKYRYVVTKIWVFIPPEGHCQLKIWDIFLFNRMKVFQNIWLVEMRFVKTSLKFRCRIL